MLHAKAVLKEIGNWFCTLIIFKNPLKIGFSIKNILLTICAGWIPIVIGYFLFEKQAFNGLRKVIGLQKYLKSK